MKKNASSLMALMVSALMAGAATPAIAQNVTADSTDTASQPVQLDPFMVNADTIGRYQAVSSTSGGRIAVNVFDAVQTNLVATQTLMQDLGSTSAIGALQYFAGASKSTGPAGSFFERITFRGFQVASAETDGFDDLSVGNQWALINLNLDTEMTDRMEVVLGADAILSPNGVPGGTLNLVTKKPQFSNFGSVAVQVGEYSTNGASLDLNRLVTKNIAVRVIAEGVDNTAYDWGYQHGLSSLTEASYLFGNGSVATVQFHFGYGHDEGAVNGGLPIDPSSGTSTKATFIAGLSKDAGSGIFANDAYKNNERSWTLLYSGNITENFATHFGLRASSFSESGYQFSLSQIGGGAYNPLTGQFTPNYTYGPAPTYTPIPAVPQSATYNISASNYTQPTYWEYTLEDDYAYKFSVPGLSSQTTAGIALANTRMVYFQQNATMAPIDIFTQVIPPVTSTPVTVNYNSSVTEYANLYLNEVFKTLKDHLIVNLGVVKDWNFIRTAQTSYTVNGNVVPFISHPSPLDFNGGAVIDVTPDIAFYYGHSGNAQVLNNPPITVPFVDRQTSKQDEEGVRFKFLNGKGLATVDYYQLYQTNFSVVNPANYTVPPPVPPLPNVLEDRIARGWEFQVNAAITDQLSTILSYTNFTNRSPQGVGFRGTAENSGAAWLHYDFKDSLKGLGLGVGYVHTGKEVGDSVSGFTAAGVVEQPSFFLPATGIWNLAASYVWGKHWAVHAFLDNATNVDYVLSAFRRTGVINGTPINPRLTVRYSF